GDGRARGHGDDVRGENRSFVPARVRPSRIQLSSRLHQMRTAMTKELSGRVAIVTGAGRNIGRGIALALADAGAAVVVNARSNLKEAEAVAGEIQRPARNPPALPPHPAPPDP